MAAVPFSSDLASRGSHVLETGRILFGMKTKLPLLLAVAAAGFFAAVAIASPPPGKGNTHDLTATDSTTTTTADHGRKTGKVIVCHKLPNGHYVLVKVSGNSSLAKLEHLGDVSVGAGGTCPGPVQNQHTTSTATTTTTS